MEIQLNKWRKEAISPVLQSAPADEHSSGLGVEEVGRSGWVW